MTRVWVKSLWSSNHNLKLQCKKFSRTRDIPNFPTQGWADTAFYTSNWNGTCIIEPTWVKIPGAFGLLDVIKEASVEQTKPFVLCFGGLAVMTLNQIVRDQGLIPCWSTDFFQITLTVTYLVHCYIWWPMWSPSSKHMRTYGGVNVKVIRCLNGLVVMMLTPDSNRPGFNPLLRHRIFSDH